MRVDLRDRLREYREAGDVVYVFVNKESKTGISGNVAGVALLVPLPCDAVVYYVQLLPWIREISLTQRRRFRKLIVTWFAGWKKGERSAGIRAFSPMFDLLQ